MDNSKDEMYNFLTKPENYMNSKYLFREIENVESRLRDEFREFLLQKLRQELAIDRFSQLVLVLDDCQFFIYKNEWVPYFKIAIDASFHFGIFLIDKPKFKERFESYYDAYYELKNIILKTKHSDNQNWLCYDLIPGAEGYFFADYRNYLKILPQNRNEEIERLAKDLMSEIDNIFDFCEYIYARIFE